MNRRKFSKLLATGGGSAGLWQARIQDADPPAPARADALFAGSVYVRGALTVHALRMTIGDDAFFRLLPEWTATRRGGNGTIAEFTALAERLSGRDLDGFFQTWLYTEDKPPYPAR